MQNSPKGAWCLSWRALLSSEPSKPYRGGHLEVMQWQVSLGVSLGNSSRVWDARPRVSHQAPRMLSSALQNENQAMLSAWAFPWDLLYLKKQTKKNQTLLSG